MSDQTYCPDDRKYSKDHIWVKKDGSEYIMGITDYAQEQLGQIVFVDLPKPEDHFDAGGELATIESVKTVSPLIMPVAGTIIAVNWDVEKDPTLVNKDCYNKGWIAKMAPDDAQAVDKLMNAAQYKASVGE